SPPGPVWTDQLSPHLQRNKQLQDTLLQREEELARLQEENNKLREFLNSSFVKNLEEKAKNLCSSRLLLDTQRISKRVCRNLTAEFCSQPEISAASEPNLDLWVLRTLGLKDRDTIDTSDDSSSSFTKCTNFSSSSSEYTLGTSYDTAVISPDHCPADSSSSDCTVHSSFSPPVSTSTPPATHNCDTYYIAFSMSLSPSSSVKTHSFPQGQAFVRKDTQGRWNFTWVPKQEP
uniref:Geminin coiled-coil domain containing n=1 Tax=Myripristis murdjan TaxID=586833 RepID=A0A668A0B3_9TELE